MINSSVASGRINNQNSLQNILISDVTALQTRINTFLGNSQSPEEIRASQKKLSLAPDENALATSGNTVKDQKLLGVINTALTSVKKAIEKILDSSGTSEARVNDLKNNLIGQFKKENWRELGDGDYENDINFMGLNLKVSIQRHDDFGDNVSFSYEKDSLERNTNMSPEDFITVLTQLEDDVSWVKNLNLNPYKFQKKLNEIIYNNQVERKMSEVF